MIKRRKKTIADELAAIPQPMDDPAPVMPEDENGLILDIANAYRETIMGNNAGSGDILWFRDSEGLNIHARGGWDIIRIWNVSDTKIHAGTGGDMIFADNFSGIIDLGADDDPDTLFLTNSPDVRIINFDPLRDYIDSDAPLA